KVMPVGTEPALTDHVRGAVPPMAAKACEYAAPTSPLGSGEAVVSDSTALVVSANTFVGAAPAASVTLTVKLLATVVVGVPLSTPAALRFTPAGRAPALIDHVYGGAPLMAANVSE